MKQTHYQVLGVKRTAGAAEVRRAYLDLARRHHPDFHTKEGGSSLANAERKMQRINEAWLVLGDAERRRTYDNELRHTQAPPPVWDAKEGRAHPDFVPFDDDGTSDLRSDRTGSWSNHDDPDLQDDVPYRGAQPVPVWQQMLPVALLMTGVGMLLLGLVVNLPPLFAIGFVLLIGSGLSFVITPLLAVLRGYDPDPEK